MLIGIFSFFSLFYQLSFVLFFIVSLMLQIYSLYWLISFVLILPILTLQAPTPQNKLTQTIRR